MGNANRLAYGRDRDLRRRFPHRLSVLVTRSALVLRTLHHSAPTGARPGCRDRSLRRPALASYWTHRISAIGPGKNRRFAGYRDDSDAGKGRHDLSVAGSAGQVGACRGNPDVPYPAPTRP